MWEFYLMKCWIVAFILDQRMVRFIFRYNSTYDWLFGSMLIASNYKRVTLEVKHIEIVAFKVYRHSSKRNHTSTNSETWNSTHINIIRTGFFPNVSKTEELTEAMLEMLKGHFLIQSIWFFNEKVALICGSHSCKPTLTYCTVTQSVHKRKLLHPLVH